MSRQLGRWTYSSTCGGLQFQPCHSGHSLCTAGGPCCCGCLCRWCRVSPPFNEKSRLDTLHHRKSIMLIESYSLARLSGFPVSNSYLVRLCANFNRNLFLVDWALNKRSDSAGDPVGGFKDVTVFAQLTSGTFMRTFILNGMGSCCHFCHQHLL